MNQHEYERANALQVGSEVDPFTEERYRQFARHLTRSHTSVLDVGCNTGRGGSVLKGLRPNLEISGLDCVQSRLDRLSTDVYRHAYYGLSTQIPCEDASFDAVVAGEFLEHLHTTDVQTTLEEFFRVLRLGGIVLLTTPNPADLKRRILGKTVLGGAHVSQHHPRTMRQRLEWSGFNRVRIYGTGRTSRILGTQRFGLALYGSYLATARKF